MTWQDVQHKLVEVQASHQMCIHKKELTELGKIDRLSSMKKDKMILDEKR